MMLFELGLFRAANTAAPFYSFAPAQTDYGSFNKGDAFLFGNERFTIAAVVHSLIPAGPNLTHRTALLLGPFAANIEGGDATPWPWLARPAE